MVLDMTEEFSQLANISPPKSQVVTIHARNKSSDICVSETDHSDSPFNSLRQKRQVSFSRFFTVDSFNF